MWLLLRDISKIMRKKIILIITIGIFQSCYFGMFLVEQNLPGNYSLWAENSFDQLKITHSKKNFRLQYYNRRNCLCDWV